MRAASESHHVRLVGTSGLNRVSLFGYAKSEVDLHLLDHGSTRSALVRPGGTRIVVEGSPEMKQWVVWTLAGKDFVCVEPWTAPADALATRRGLLYVDPGEARTIGMLIRLET